MYRTCLVLLCLLLGSASMAHSQVTADATPTDIQAQRTADTTVSAADALILEAKTLMQLASTTGNPDRMAQARPILERATGDAARGALAHYYLGHLHASWMNLIQDDKDAQKQHLDQAIEHLEQAIDVDDQMADAYALLGGLYGQKVAFAPMRAMFLGPKADRMLDQAFQLEPDNPRTALIAARSTYYKPRMFGGDKEAALEGFERAASLFEESMPTDPVQPSWGHDESYAWIGIAHMDAERMDEAQAAFERALEINPDYGWVRHVLMPAATQ
ncbi:MAG: tetratricopeptide repeat protein [Bacteroidota bacterium]